MTAPHNGLLLFPLRFAILSAGGESLEGTGFARYTPHVGGPVSVMPGACLFQVFNLRHLMPDRAS
jgi:hypothetical protein